MRQGATWGRRRQNQRKSRDGASRGSVPRPAAGLCRTERGQGETGILRLTAQGSEARGPDARDSRGPHAGRTGRVARHAARACFAPSCHGRGAHRRARPGAAVLRGPAPPRGCTPAPPAHERPLALRTAQRQRGEPAGRPHGARRPRRSRAVLRRRTRLLGGAHEPWRAEVQRSAGHPSGRRATPVPAALRRRRPGPARGLLGARGAGRHEARGAGQRRGDCA